MFPGGPGHSPGKGYGDHSFLAAAAFGKFPGKGLGKLELPAELAAAMTFLFICSHCHAQGDFSPREPLAAAYLSRPGVPAPCACVTVPRGVCSSVFLGVCMFVHIYLFIFMGVYIYISIPETFGEAGIRGGGVGCLPDS